MSVTYNAYAVLGVRIPYDDLVKEVSARIRGCNHEVDEEFKFCPKCGKEVWEEEFDDANVTDIDAMYCSAWGEFEVMRPTDSAYVYVGYIADCGSYDLDDYEPVYDVKNKLRSGLQEIGLWKEEDYGLYAILTVD